MNNFLFLRPVVVEEREAKKDETTSAKSRARLEKRKMRIGNNFE